MFVYNLCMNRRMKGCKDACMCWQLHLQCQILDSIWHRDIRLILLILFFHGFSNFKGLILESIHWITFNTLACQAYQNVTVPSFLNVQMFFHHSLFHCKLCFGGQWKHHHDIVHSSLTQGQSIFCLCQSVLDDLKALHPSRKACRSLTSTSIGRPACHTRMLQTMTWGPPIVLGRSPVGEWIPNDGPRDICILVSRKNGGLGGGFNFFQMTCLYFRLVMFWVNKFHDSTLMVENLDFLERMDPWNSIVSFMCPSWNHHKTYGKIHLHWMSCKFSC